MKYLAKLTLIAVMGLMISCSGNKEPKEVYEYVEKVPELSAELKEKIGDWAAEGAECYGILALIDGQGVIQEGAVIQARILRFRGDSVKMKSLTSLQLREVEGCTQMGISKGDTWWETEGDIFKTEEEAQSSLDERLGKPTV